MEERGTGGFEHRDREGTERKIPEKPKTFEFRNGKTRRMEKKI